jgi:uncharacterized RDD family membrane protein YckC
MKTTPRTFLLRAALAFSLALAPVVLLAQDNKQQPEPAPAPAEKAPAVVAPAEQPAAPASAAQPAPAPATAPATPATPPTAATPETPPTPETPATPATPAAAPTSPAKDFVQGFKEGFSQYPETTPATKETPPKLRRLDEPSAPGDAKSWRRAVRAHRHSTGNEIVNVGSDSFLAKDHKADSVVAVFGSATSEGEVSDAVVSIFGNTRVTGPAGDAAVAVFGNVYVNSKIGDSAVAVFGNVELGPDAEVGEVVAVGGKVIRDPKAIVHGQVNNVSFGGHFSDFGWLQNWIANCALYFRPLAFAPGLMWAWWIALGFLAFYVVLALLFAKGVTKCVDTFEQRPGFSILSALLTVLLAPVAMILLAITGIGIAVIPFLAAGLFFAALFGKVVMLAWLGRRLAKLLGSDHPALAVLLGGVILLFLYTVPVLGLVLYKLLGWIGLGVVVYTLMLGMKREKPAAPPVVPPAPGATATPGDPAAPGLPVAVAAPPVITAVTLPRAGFWIRTAALLLDAILVAMLCTMLNGIFTFGSHVHIRSDLLPALAVYGAVMWKLKGTTVGGIVCGLKVVRLDDRPIDWGTAIVRALGCFLSLIVLGLGFIWVAFDDHRQSWHDKIAGTTVVRMPKGVSLV